MRWNFWTRAEAEAFAHLLTRMTGDPTKINHYNRMCFSVMRYSGSRWVNA